MKQGVDSNLKARPRTVRPLQVPPHLRDSVSYGCSFASIRGFVSGRNPFAIALLLALGALLGGCVTRATRPTAPPPLVLISLDAFRWDYTAMHPAETPHLRNLIENGVTAESLIPVFPSNTFPNHYSIVTGLYPARHGMINNDMFDAERGEFFSNKQPNANRQSHWWGGEPIWVTAIKQGGTGGCWFWPGSEAELHGIRPAYWRPYDEVTPFERRLDDLAAWLEKTDRSKPAVAVLYLEETNSIGHRFGPGSPELAATIKTADARIGALHARLRSQGIEPNLVIVSDHGMTAIDPSRVVLLDDYIDVKKVQIDFEGSVVGLRPRDGDVDTLMRAFSNLAHAKAYRAEDLPARFHLRDHPRSPAVWLLPDEGWEIYPRARFERFRDRMNKGDHGYDPALRSMHGIFVAYGPSFRRGVEIPSVENVHIYNLMCAALGLRPAPNDGDDRLVKSVLE